MPGHKERFEEVLKGALGLGALMVQEDYTTLSYTTLHYTTLHYTTLHYTALHYTTLHYTTLHHTILVVAGDAW